MPELYAKLAVVLAALVVAAPPRAGSGDVTVALPPGWHSTTPGQGRYLQPRTRIVVSSGPIHSDLRSVCQTQIASYTFPSTAVAIVVVEWTQQIGGMKIGHGLRRPRHFTAANLPIHRPPIIECFSDTPRALAVSSLGGKGRNRLVGARVSGDRAVADMVE